MKKIVYALLFGLLSIGLQAQESAEKHTLTAKITQTPQAYLDSIKKTFVNHKAGAEIDKKWMQEIMNDDLFESMKNDVEYAYLDKTVEYDLSTDLLKERLRNLNNKSVFNIHHNESIEKVIKNFLKNRSKSYERLMALSEYYFPLFEERLNKYDVPLEIKYLAIVESALNPNAKSRMGATGLWQFMYGTAKQYKLDINTYVDERSDPVKSTEAAVKYLRDLYDVFGNWELALASYNAGPGNVSKAIRRAGGETDYWKIRRFLPKETQGYIPAFIATMYMYEYHKEHNIVPKRAKIPFVKTDTIQVKRNFTFQEIAALIDISEEELKMLNPKYKLAQIPKYEGSKYSLRLPIDKMGRFTSNEKKIYAYLDYVEKYHEKGNNLEQNTPSVSNKVIANETSSSNKKQSFYTIKKGDTLEKIASRYQISIQELKQMNGLKSNLIHPGKKIKVIENSTSLHATYTVKAGDTLHSIAKKVGNVSVNDLMKANNIKNPQVLKPGMVLKINS